MNPQPKTKPFKDYAYRAYLEQQPCCVCGYPRTCVAHQRYGADGGTSIKPSDSYGLPLCHACHDAQHREGERSFWQDRGINPWRLMVYFLTEFRKQEGK